MNFQTFSFWILFFISFSYLCLCPYSKVEESFNLQATHDLYYYGIQPALQQKWFPHKNFSSFSSSFTNSSSPSIVLLPYDHLIYPGVVPRTFLGPYILSILLHVISFFIRICTFNQIHLHTYPLFIQFLSRALLLLIHLHAHWTLAKAADTLLNCHQQQQQNKKKKTYRHGSFGGYYLLITAVQFHIPYYSSRMLPNIFALILVIHAYADWFTISTSNMRKRQHESYPRVAIYLILATVIFRCDVLLLLGTIGITLVFIQQYITLSHAIQVGLVTSSLSIVCTGLLDAILWFPQGDTVVVSRAITTGGIQNHPLWTFFLHRIWKHILFWPEGMVFVFNAIDNKSSEYGISPWYWYWTSALPKALLGTAFFIPLAFWKDPHHPPHHHRKGLFHAEIDMTIVPFLVPCLLFVALYSILPHKEIRFIFVILPMLNITAAKGLTYLHTYIAQSWENITTKKMDENIVNPSSSKSKLSLIRHLFVTRDRSFLILLFYILFALALLLSSFVGSLIFVATSRHNYPGGRALELLRENIQSVDLSSLSIKNDEWLSHNPCIMTRRSSEVQANKYVKIYVDVASSMTGVSLFGQRSVSEACAKLTNSTSFSCSFVKAGYESEHDQSLYEQNLQNVMYIVTEKSIIPEFHIVGISQGFPRLQMFRISTYDAIYVMRNENCL